MLDLIKSSIESEENFIDLGFSEPQNYEFYSLKSSYIPATHPKKIPGLVVGQTYRVSPDMVVYKRTIYTFLDFLGDVGGLLEGLNLIGAALIGLIYSSSL